MSEQNSSNQGYLILIGGAEDKQKEKIVLRRVLETSQSSKVILIPTASSYPTEVAETYYEAFKSIGVTDFEYLDIRYKDEANKKSFVDKLDETQLIYFSGGDQVKLVRALHGTRFYERMKENFFNRRMTIAGTSAGAAAAGDMMLYDGDYKGLIKGTVLTEPGFGLLQGITIDTHFLARSRIARLSQFLVMGMNYRGIGLDEDTGIVINPDLRFEVVGSGVATVISSDKVTYSDYDDIEDENIFSVNNLRIGFLASGSVFSLKRWMVLKPNSIVKKKTLINEEYEYS